MEEPTSKIQILEPSEWKNLQLHTAIRKIYEKDINYDIEDWLKKGFVKNNELEEAIEFSKKYKKYYKKQLDELFWDTNIYLSDYDFNIELQKTKFLIDMLESIYKFSIKNGEVNIFKKTKNSCIDEKISRNDFIYEIQIELVEYCELKLLFKTEIKQFYILFGKIEDLNKAIDNIIYFKKRLQ